MTLSPYVIFSTWFTFHVYQGHSDEENATFVRALYRYISGCFADNSCVLPSFDFNLSDFTHFSKLLLFMTSIKSPGGLRNFLPEDYLICVKACSKMTFILGMLKSIVCGLGTGLAMCTWEGGWVPRMRWEVREGLAETEALAENSVVLHIRPL